MVHDEQPLRRRPLMRGNFGPRREPAITSSSEETSSDEEQETYYIDDGSQATVRERTRRTVLPAAPVPPSAASTHHTQSQRPTGRLSRDRGASVAYRGNNPRRLSANDERIMKWDNGAPLPSAASVVQGADGATSHRRPISRESTAGVMGWNDGAPGPSPASVFGEDPQVASTALRPMPSDMQPRDTPQRSDRPRTSRRSSMTATPRPYTVGPPIDIVTPYIERRPVDPEPRLARQATQEVALPSDASLAQRFERTSQNGSRQSAGSYGPTQGPPISSARFWVQREPPTGFPSQQPQNFGSPSPGAWAPASGPDWPGNYPYRGPYGP